MIIPAFDFINGQAVRLYQGDYAHKKDYIINIQAALDEYQSKGVKIVHLVDLDGAKDSNNRQLKLFKHILSSTTLPIQVGGGIRSEKDINMFLELGATRVVIGSSVIKNKNEAKKWLKIYGTDKIILALDVNINIRNNKEIYIRGWQEKTKITLEEIIEDFSPYGLKHVLCTDISKDGTLLGPNIKLYKEISNVFKHIDFQASGGVGTLQDIISLRKTKVKSIILGRSLLEGKFTIEEALQCWQKEL